MRFTSAGLFLRGVSKDLVLSLSMRSVRHHDVVPVSYAALGKGGSGNCVEEEGNNRLAPSSCGRELEQK